MADDAAIEEMAAVEHDQWVAWATTILRTEAISPERRSRWEPYLVPYAELPDEVKEFDRIWARKALAAYRQHQRAAGIVEVPREASDTMAEVAWRYLWSQQTHWGLGEVKTAITLAIAAAQEREG